MIKYASPVRQSHSALSMKSGINPTESLKELPTTVFIYYYSAGIDNNCQ